MSESGYGLGCLQPRPNCTLTLPVAHTLPRKRLNVEFGILGEVRLTEGELKMNGMTVDGFLVKFVLILGLPDLIIHFHHIGLDPLPLPPFSLLALLALPLILTITIITLTVDAGMMLARTPMKRNAAQQEQLQHQQQQPSPRLMTTIFAPLVTMARWPLLLLAGRVFEASA